MIARHWYIFVLAASLLSTVNAGSPRVGMRPVLQDRRSLIESEKNRGTSPESWVANTTEELPIGIHTPQDAVDGTVMPEQAQSEDITVGTKQVKSGNDSSDDKNQIKLMMVVLIVAALVTCSVAMCLCRVDILCKCDNWVDADSQSPQFGPKNKSSLQLEEDNSSTLDCTERRDDAEESRAVSDILLRPV